MPNLGPSSEEAHKWSSKDVVVWVKQILESRYGEESMDFGGLANQFEAHMVDGSILLNLSEAELRDIVPLVGARKVIMEKVMVLRKGRRPSVGWGFNAPPPSGLYDRNKSVASVRADINIPILNLNEYNMTNAVRTVQRPPQGEVKLPGQQSLTPENEEASEDEDRTWTMQACLEAQRPTHGKEGVALLPVPSLESQEKSRLAGLFDRSLFSNVQLVDYEYALPVDHLPWWRQQVAGIQYFFARIFFFCNTIFHLLTPGDVCYCACALGAVVFCEYQNITANIHPSLLMNVVIFPLSFAVNAAYQRREAALQLFAAFKGTTLNVYMLHKCWQYLDDIPVDFLECSKRAIVDIFDHATGYMTAPGEMEKVEHLHRLYELYNEVNLINDVLRLAGLQAPLVARPVADLKDSLSAFESLRVYSDYRTPSTIRSFIRLCIYAVPILLAPYFAYAISTEHANRVLTYCISAFLPLLFLLLKNVQRELENPFAGFDGDSDPDDIRLDQLQLVKFVEGSTVHPGKKKTA